MMAYISNQHAQTYYQGSNPVRPEIKVDSKKELEYLKENTNYLYRIYVGAFSNMVSSMLCQSGPLVHGADPDDDLGIGNLAVAIAVRGAKKDWTLLNKVQFVEKMQEYLTGKTYQ